MLLFSIYIVAGLALLAFGGDLLLKGSVALASRLKLTPAVIGLTVVAAGTSVPELAVSVLASINGQVDIAVANVVGSNIMNASLILGMAALVTPLVVTGSAVRLEYPVMFLVTLMCVVVFQDGVVGRLDAILFLLTYVGFTAYMISLVRGRLQQEERVQMQNEVKEIVDDSTDLMRTGRIGLLVSAGILLLAVGAELTVHGAVALGKLAGLSERVIGLTIVAIGTSLPEIITSLIAGVRGRNDVAIANIIGSNIFNILIILGLSALLAPLHVAREIVSYDAFWMLGIALVLFPLMRSGMRVTRLEGSALILACVIYIYSLLCC